MSIENASIVGNLVDDPDLRYTPDGTAVATIRVASSRSVYNPQTGQREDRDTLFLTISCWKSLGENVAASLRKGQRVVVSGRLTERSWETREGDRRSRIEMTAEAVGPDLRFASADLGPSQASGAPSGYGGGSPAPPSGGHNNDPWGGGSNPGHTWGQ